MSLKTKAVSGSEQTRAGKLSDWQPDPVESGFSGKVSDRQADSVESGLPGKGSENRTGEPKLTGARLGNFGFTDIQLVKLYSTRLAT